MKKYSIIIVFLLMLSVRFVAAQNIVSLEAAPFAVAFAYGLDYHPAHYTQLKSTMGFAWGNNIFMGPWHAWVYNFSVEQRYYYNMLKRQAKEKNTRNKSANFFSIRPTYIHQVVFSTNELDNEANNGFYCPINWGLRRAIGNRFYFEGNLGAGPLYSVDDSSWGTLVNINIIFGVKLGK